MNQLPATSPVITRGGAAAVAPARPPRIAFIQAGWHADIVRQGHTGFVAECERLRPGAPPAIDVHEVPGAFEIPLLAQAVARRGVHDAIVACALVVDGGIYRHDFVAAAVIDGLMRVQMDTGVPVFSAVLTPRDFHDSQEHHDFFHQHFVKKGTELARACAATVELHRSLEVQHTPKAQPLHSLAA